MIGFFEEIKKMIDKGKLVEIVHMGFSKAFDKVPHGSLVQKVKSHIIRRDLGEQVHRLLKVAAQVDKVVKQVYGMLAFIGIEYKD
eukprot:g21493.t1